MKILLSPAKKMRRDVDSLAPLGLPVFLDKTRQILDRLQAMDPAALQALWGCSDAIAAQNVERLRDLDLLKGLTPAVLSYDGIAFQYMAPSVFEDAHFSYIQEHLRILSGFYGVLKPMDGVQPYRLEMQAKLKIGDFQDLYAFWGRDLYEEVKDSLLIDLASKEYSKCIEKYLEPETRLLTCVFCEQSGGKLVQKGTFAKMARGEMVRYLAEHRVEDPEEMQGFDRLGYHFRGDLSRDTEYVFERIPEKR